MAKIFKPLEELDFSYDASSLGDFIFKQLDLHHDKVILIDGASGRKWTGAQMKETVKNYTVALIEKLGMALGDVCCISYDNCDTTVLIALAIISAGGIVSCAFPLDPYPEVLYLAKKTNPKYLFCHSKNQSWAERLNKDLNLKVQTIIMDYEVKQVNNSVMHIDTILKFKSDSSYDTTRIPVDVGDIDEALAFITLSSGTTGTPKAIPTTHKACMYTPRQLPGGMGEIYSCAATLDYTSAKVIILGAIYSGYAAVLMNGFELTNVLANIEKYRISVCFVGSAAFHSIITYNRLDNYDISSLKVVFPMGARLPSTEDLAKFLEKRSHIKCCMQGFGTSEGAGSAIKKMTPEQFIKDPGNCGVLLPSVQLKVVDPQTGALLGCNQRGMLHIKSPCMFKGYYDASLKRCSTSNDEMINYKCVILPETFDEDDFYITGDIGYMSDKEELFVEGRMKELMTCKGAKKVLPQELEEVIQEHPLVLEVTVLGIPSKKDIGIDCPRAFIVLKNPIDLSIETSIQRVEHAKQIMNYANDMIGWDKQLTGGIVILDHIPRLRSTGKVNKLYLKSLQPSSELTIYRDESQ